MSNPVSKLYRQDHISRTVIEPSGSGLFLTLTLYPRQGFFPFYRGLKNRDKLFYRPWLCFLSVRNGSWWRLKGIPLVSYCRQSLSTATPFWLRSNRNHEGESMSTTAKNYRPLNIFLFRAMKLGMVQEDRKSPLSVMYITLHISPLPSFSADSRRQEPLKGQ